MDNAIITIDSSEDEDSQEKVKNSVDKDVIILDEENTAPRRKRKSESEEDMDDIKETKRIKLINLQQNGENIIKNEINEDKFYIDVKPSTESIYTNTDPSTSAEKRIKLINLQQNGENIIKNEINEKNFYIDVKPSTESIQTNTDPSTSAESVTVSEFEKFIATCTTSEYEKKYKEAVIRKIPNLMTKYNDADENFVTSRSFKDFLLANTKRIVQNPSNTIIIFNDVFRELESKKKRNTNLTDRELSHLKKLNRTLRKVLEEIKRLENEEVDFEADNNSSYIMLQRYRERLCTIQKKICSYTKENYYSGRYLYRSLDFNASKYPEINRAIDKLYNKTKQFPSFYDVYNCIKKCAKNNNIQFTDDELDFESRKVFAAVGNIIQGRRKSELYESLSYFLEGSDGDPAEKDAEINNVLHNRQREHKQRIDEVIQKFTDCQERGDEEPDLSSDSDDSHYLSEESNN